MTETSSAALRACIHPDCDREKDPLGGEVCCISCGMAWAARTAPVHINRCDVRQGLRREPCVITSCDKPVEPGRSFYCTAHAVRYGRQDEADTWDRDVFDALAQAEASEVAAGEPS